MDRYEVRQLKAGDERLLGSVAPDVFDQPVDLDRARRYLAGSHNLFYVAMCGDLVVGMVSGLIYSHPDKPPEMWINEIGVGRDHRQRGVATALAKAIDSGAKALGCRGCWLATSPDNVAANALYRALPGWSGPSPAVLYVRDFDGPDG